MNKRMKNAVILSVINNKGGVGKTTTALNLGAFLSEAGKKTLLVDMDSQCSLSKALGYDIVQEGTYSALKGETYTIQKKTESLRVLPAERALAGFEVEIASQPGSELRLKETLEPLRQEYDFIIIDCPPTLSLLTYNALTASNYYIVPVECEYLALVGLEKMEELIRVINKYLNKDLKMLGVLMTKYDRRKSLNRQSVKLVAESYGELVFKTLIRDNIALAEAPISHVSIAEYAAGSNGAKDYRDLSKEVLKRVKR